MIKPKPYDGRLLEGECIVTRKIDGVRALREGDCFVSRNGKPLYGLSHLPHKLRDCEIYLGSWEASVSYVRSLNSRDLSEDYVFSLEPLDKRLYLLTTENLSSDDVMLLMEGAKERGDEGLVIYNKGSSWKVKFEETYDVPVLGYTAGKGKYAGLVGALITPMGKVSGLTDEQRVLFLTRQPSVIEVACMHLTKTGKFRHPRLKRERFDKEVLATNDQG